MYEKDVTKVYMYEITLDEVTEHQKENKCRKFSKKGIYLRTPKWALFFAEMHLREH